MMIGVQLTLSTYTVLSVKHSILSFHRLNFYTNVTILNVYSSGLTVLNMLLFMGCKRNSYSSLKHTAMIPETLVTG